MIEAAHQGLVVTWRCTAGGACPAANGLQVSSSSTAACHRSPISAQPATALPAHQDWQACCRAGRTLAARRLTCHLGTQPSSGQHGQPAPASALHCSQWPPASEAGAALLAPIERVEPPPWAGHGAAAALSTAGQPKRRARHRRQHQQHTATAKRHRSATRHTASAAAAAGSDEDCSLPRWASNLGRHTGAPVGSWLVRSSTVNANCHQPRRWLKQKLNEKATT